MAIVTTASIDVEVIKRCHSVVDLAERHGVRLRRSGRCLVGLCPLHEETTPSFTLYPHQNSFHCFGCGAGGDVISLAIALEGHRWPAERRFREACAYLAGTLPATPIERPPAPPPALTERAAAIPTAVAAAYAAELARARALLADLDAAGARDPAARRDRIADAGLAGAVAGLAYLRNRGVPDAAPAAAGVGWCEGDALAALANRHGWSAAELVELGLLRPTATRPRSGASSSPSSATAAASGSPAAASPPAARSTSRCACPAGRWAGGGRRRTPGRHRRRADRLPGRARLGPAGGGAGRPGAGGGRPGRPARRHRHRAAARRRRRRPGRGDAAAGAAGRAGARRPAAARRPRTWPTWRACPTAGERLLAALSAPQ